MRIPFEYQFTEQQTSNELTAFYYYLLHNVAWLQKHYHFSRIVVEWKQKFQLLSSSLLTIENPAAALFVINHMLQAKAESPFVSL